MEYPDRQQWNLSQNFGWELNDLTCKQIKQCYHKHCLHIIANSGKHSLNVTPIHTWLLLPWSYYKWIYNVLNVRYVYPIQLDIELVLFASQKYVTANFIYSSRILSLHCFFPVSSIPVCRANFVLRALHVLLLLFHPHNSMRKILLLSPF